MACDLTKGRAKSCKSGVAGVSSIYFYNFLLDSFTVVDGSATAMNVGLTAAYEYKIEGDLNTLVESMASDRNNGTSINTQTITASLKQISAADGAELNLMARGYPMAVIKDRNGVYSAVGIDDGIDFTVEQNTGGAKADFNGYTLTGVSTTNALSPKLDEATITAFLAVVS